jgi:hypothetical protein
MNMSTPLIELATPLVIVGNDGDSVGDIMMVILLVIFSLIIS